MTSHSNLTRNNDNSNWSNWSEWSMYVLKELERLNEEAEDLYSKMEEYNASKETLDTIKRWKFKVESVATFDDFRAMKANVTEFKTFKVQIVTAVIVSQAIITAVAALVMWWFK